MAKAKDQSATGIAPAGDAGRQLARAAGTAIQRTDVNDYAIVMMATGAKEQGLDVRGALAENIGGGSLSAFDFQRIRVPAGGGLAWEVMNADTGEVEVATEFEGIIVNWKDQKAYWRQGLDEAGAVQGPPNCFSPDTIHGIGDPGIPCATCKFNQFGTAKGGAGRGKACKDVRLLFVCRPGDVLPELLPVPPTSLKAIRDYMLKLAAKGVRYHSAVTRFKLTPDKNGAGIKYSKIEFALAGVVNNEAMPVVREYADVVKAMLGNAQVPLKAEDVTGGGADRSGGERVAAAANGDDVIDVEPESDRVGAVL
jgi:hypothetical protein